MGSDVEKPTVLEVQGQTSTNKNKRPKRDCLCRLMNVLTAMCALLCLVAHCLAIAVGPSIHDVTGMLQQTLRIYGISFAVLIMLTETEWEYFLSQFRVLDSWLGRGGFQMFEAVLTLELSRSTAPGQSDFHKSLRLYRVVAGISLLVCSGLYMLGGVLCWGRHKAKVRYQREAEKQRVLEDLEALDSKRQELKGLLAVYSNH